MPDPESIEFFWDGDTEKPVPGPGAGHISDEVLRRNAHWFMRLRWIVAVLCSLYSLLSLSFPDLLHMAGLSAAVVWPAIIAAILIPANVVFGRLLGKSPRTDASLSPYLIVWLQIILDLACLTVVVHFVGSIGTPGPYLYLLHVALACVFFTASASLAVTALSCFLYIATVILERSGVIEPSSLLWSPATLDLFTSGQPTLIQVVSVCLLLFLVWYLVSRLSIAIREREHELMQAQERIRSAQEQKDRHALKMTHQLKSPLDTIRSGIAMIRGETRWEIPESFQDLLGTMEERARVMGELILDVLRLAQLSFDQVGTEHFRGIELHELVSRCITEVQPSAQRRGISILPELSRVTVRGIPQQLSFLAGNLLSNAVTYSNEGGTVRVRCGMEQGWTGFTVEDEGIGISPEKVRRIFDEFYRAKEAVEHNPFSTGIGLSIVRQVARIHRIRIRIDSAPGRGTRFTVVFPGESDNSGAGIS